MSALRTHLQSIPQAGNGLVLLPKYVRGLHYVDNSNSLVSLLEDTPTVTSIAGFHTFVHFHDSEESPRPHDPKILTYPITPEPWVQGLLCLLNVS